MSNMHTAKNFVKRHPSITAYLPDGTATSIDAKEPVNFQLTAGRTIRVRIEAGALMITEVGLDADEIVVKPVSGNCVVIKYT